MYHSRTHHCLLCSAECYWRWHSNTYTDDESEAQIADTCVIHISRNPEELAAAKEAETKGENAKDVSMYVRVGDSQIIYELDSVDYGILSNASYDDLRHKEVFWGDFEDVYRLDITLEGETHTLVSEVNEEKERIWYFSGETVEPASTEEDALDLTDFEDALNALYADRFTREEPTGKEEIRLTLHLENETFPEVEIALYRYDGTSCLAVIDGESVSFVPRTSVMELVETVQKIVLNQ